MKSLISGRIFAPKGRQDDSAGHPKWCALAIELLLLWRIVISCCFFWTWRMTREDVADMIERHRNGLYRQLTRKRCDLILAFRPNPHFAPTAGSRQFVIEFYYLGRGIARPRTRTRGYPSTQSPSMLMESRALVRRWEINCPSAAVLSVELPGIEPVAKCALTCGNVEVDYAKRRQTT